MLTIQEEKGHLAETVTNVTPDADVTVEEDADAGTAAANPRVAHGKWNTGLITGDPKVDPKVDRRANRKVDPIMADQKESLIMNQEENILTTEEARTDMLKMAECAPTVKEEDTRRGVSKNAKFIT